MVGQAVLCAYMESGRDVPQPEELICFAFGRHISDRFRVVGGADPYSKHFNGFVGERLAAPAAGGWIMKHVG